MRLKVLLIPIVAVGVALGASSIAGATGSHAAGTLNVMVGGGTTGVAANDFFPDQVTIHKGDTVHFANTYAEPHTVTFVPAPMDMPELVIPGPAGPPQFGINPVAANPTHTGSGPATLDPNAFYNSGIVDQGHAADLTFDTAGTFTLHCLFHPDMHEVVNVIAPADVIPSQADVDAAGKAQLDQAIATGKAIAAGSQQFAGTPSGDGSMDWRIQVGGGQGIVDLLQFMPANVKINVGDSITFTNPTATPHTVTFPDGAPEPELIVPSGSFLAFNPQALLPGGGTTVDGSGFVNSGFIGVGFPAQSATFKFTKAGSFEVMCILHDPEGMTGTITVGAAPATTTPSTPTGTIAPPNTGMGPSASGVAGSWLAAIMVLGATGAALVLAGTRRIWTRV